MNPEALYLLYLDYCRSTRMRVILPVGSVTNITYYYDASCDYVLSDPLVHRRF
jgi:hypothetical protein